MIENLKKQISEIIDKIQTEWDLLVIDLKSKRITNRVRVFFASISVFILLVVGVVLLVVAGKNKAADAATDTDVNKVSEESVEESSNDAKADESKAEEKTDSINDPGKGDKSSEEENMDDSVILAATDDAGEQYINDTLFIGDSNTVRMMNYGITSLDNTIAVVGMGIQSVKSLKCVQFSGHSSPVTMVEAVKSMQPRRIIITFGTNNANGMDVDTFTSKYEEALDAIHDAYPYADILINSIPPISMNNSYPTLDQKNIDKFNTALVTMAGKLGYKFIDSSSVMKDSYTGYAKNGFTVSDGIHISEDGFAAMFTYIRTHHSLVLSDKRPKPLKAIPKQVKATYVIDSSGNMNNDPDAYKKMSEVSKEQQEALKALQEAALKAAKEALAASNENVANTITPTPTVTETPTQGNNQETAKPTPTVTPTPTPTPVPESKPTPTPEPKPTPIAEPTPAPAPEPTPAPAPEPEPTDPTPVVTPPAENPPAEEPPAENPPAEEPPASEDPPADSSSEPAEQSE